jgi:hypothetical protein
MMIRETTLAAFAWQVKLVAGRPDCDDANCLDWGH